MELTSKEKLLNVLKDVRADVRNGVVVRSLTEYSRKHKCTAFGRNFITGIADKSDEELIAIVEQIKQKEKDTNKNYQRKREDGEPLFNQPKEMTDKEMVDKLRENGWDVTCTRSL